jgi:hypothetical protein
MSGGFEPVTHNLLELGSGHAGMRPRYNLQETFLARGEQSFHIASQHRFERFFRLPLGMLRRERLDAIHCEQKLKIHRLLGPESAVVIKRRDSLVKRNDIRRTFLGHFLDKGDDRFLRRGVVPGRKRVLGLERCEREEKYGNESFTFMILVLAPTIRKSKRPGYWNLGLINKQNAQRPTP